MLILLKTAAGFVFDDARGKIAAAVAGILILISGFAWDQRSRGARNALQDVNQSAVELARKGRAARDAAAGVDAVERMRREFCRDC